MEIRMFIIPILVIISVFLVLKKDKRQNSCKLCGKENRDRRVHDFNHDLMLKSITDIEWVISFKPKYRTYEKSDFIYGEIKVNEISLFHHKSSDSQNTKFPRKFYPLKHDRTSISGHSSIMCGHCFKENFKDDSRSLYDVLQNDNWFS
ncbi:MAG: hypothetical protein RJB25_284 [Bacteroidota bacterium]|jgi:hypothetical protein